MVRIISKLLKGQSKCRVQEMDPTKAALLKYLKINSI